MVGSLGSPMLLGLFTLVACTGFSDAFWGISSGEETQEMRLGLAKSNNCQKIYKDINYYLFDNVKSSAAKPNLKAAFDLLIHHKKSLFPNKTFIECLELLISLMHIQPQNQCNRNSYSILVGNHLATGRALDERMQAPRRIDNLFHEYCVEHAKNCLNIYPLMFRLRYKKMNYILLQRVETFVNEIMYSTSYDVYKRCNRQSIYDNFIAKPVSVASPIDAGIAYEAVKLLAKDHPDWKYLQRCSDERVGKLIFVESKIRNLFKKYLVEPCQYYVRELGPDVFGPASFDDQFVDKTRDLDYAELHYFRSWARYRFCSALIDRDQEYLIKEILRIAQLAPSIASTQS